MPLLTLISCSYYTQGRPARTRGPVQDRHYLYTKQPHVCVNKGLIMNSVS